jgi:hypothetical protein
MPGKRIIPQFCRILKAPSWLKVELILMANRSEHFKKILPHFVGWAYSPTDLIARRGNWWANTPTLQLQRAFLQNSGPRRLLHYFPGIQTFRGDLRDYIAPLDRLDQTKVGRGKELGGN